MIRRDPKRTPPRGAPESRRTKVATPSGGDRAPAEPTLLAGGNPRIAKAEGDAPVQAYIAAMPGWKVGAGGVETAPPSLDVALVEGARPWIGANPRGALLGALLRRSAYAILTLVRSVTPRADERRDGPWKTWLGELLHALMTLTMEPLGPRTPRVPASD
jgi:hypothetical protein